MEQVGLPNRDRIIKEMFASGRSLGAIAKQVNMTAEGVRLITVRYGFRRDPQICSACGNIFVPESANILRCTSCKTSGLAVGWYIRQREAKKRRDELQGGQIKECAVCHEFKYMAVYHNGNTHGFRTVCPDCDKRRIREHIQKSLVDGTAGHSKLNMKQVQEIVTLRGQGLSQLKIARRYGVSQTTISSLLRGCSAKEE